MRPKVACWTPRVTACSARTGAGLDELWEIITAHRQALLATGDFESHRKQQLVRWMWSMIQDRLSAALREHPAVQKRLSPLETAVAEGQVTASQAATELLRAFGVTEQ